MIKRIIVDEPDYGKRLDKYLSDVDRKHSRSEYEKLIKKGSVLVNNNVVKSSYHVGTNDVVEISHTIETIDPLRPIKKPLNIIFENDDILVIDKQINLTVHPPNDHDPQETVVNYLLHHYPTIKSVGDDPLRPGIVHRLDKLASGVLIIAKNNKSFEYLKTAWQEGAVNKSYTVLVWGVLDRDGIINTPIVRSKKTGKMVTHSEGKNAETHFTIVTRYTNATLLHVTTLTGRMHQIRTHFKSIGHPVIGDPVYVFRKIPHRLTPPRLFLHASQLSLTLMDGESKTFEAPLPKNFSDFLNNLKEKK